MRKYYAGATDPVNGQLINPGAPRGTETDDIFALGLAFQERLPEPAFDGLFYWVFGPSFGYPNSAVNFANFDFHHDIDKVDDDTPPAVQMTRPLCVFPKVAKYRGSGSTNIAANFVCVTDEHDFNQTPAPKYGP